MENMARLAVLERALQKRHIFNEVLVQLYKTVSYILDDPHDVDAKVINDPILSKVYDCTAFHSYMEYIGFQKLSNQYVFNRKASISRLKLAQAALDKKLNYVFGRNRPCLIVLPSGQDKKKNTYNMSTPGNPFLVRIQHLFNEMMKYEDKELQEEALRHMPLVKLQIKAMERMRDHQKKIKAGDTQVQEISFEMALLMELLGWFKYDFFSWVNEPQCESCNIPTKHIKTMENAYVEGERCRVEIYICQICRGEVQFPRLNNPRTLLRTRRGRCGEWANCFVLLCRALGYDTRYVFDVSDHVWCEVYDIVSKCWLHVDPCEGRIDTPLMYSHGWGKKLSYVLAFSRDDLQDVTWRYTSNHKEVMSRRRSASEQDVVNTILRLRSYSYRRLSPARQRFLTLRNIAELASFMVERQPSDYEAQGRISGSIQWRTERGEVGKHVFVFDHPGDVGVSYCTSEDRYRVTRPGGADELVTWASGAHESTGIFRKVETDWRQTYLARVEGEETGSISWRIQTDRPELQFQRLAARLAGAEYHSGVVRWSLRFDDEQPIHVRFDDSVKEFNRTFRSVTIRAELSGGLGDVAWQHAQLFRQSLEDKTPLFDIHLKLGVN